MTAQRAFFLGSKAFGLSILRTLVQAEPALRWSVQHPDDRADSRSTLASFEEFCAERRIPLDIAARSRDAYAAIEASPPDIVFVCGWYFLIPADILDISRFFAIHNSLLPKYRGGAPLVWAIMRREPIVGSTLFGLQPGMDDGPIHLQVSTSLSDEDDVATVLGRLEQRFLAALPEAWPAIVSGADRSREQDDAQASYCGQRVPEDGHIDWGRKAADIHAFVRAQTRPYPGAFTNVAAGRIWIWRTRLVAAPYCGTPGQILERREGEVVIACGGDSAIAVLEASGEQGETRLTSLFPSLALRLGGQSASI